MRYRCSVLAPNVRRFEMDGRAMGLGVGRGGWRKQRPQRGQCGGRLEAVGGGEGVEHVGRRRITLIAAGLGDDKAKLTGHSL